MATVLCKDLGGPSDCEHVVEGGSFAEMAQHCKAHVMAELGKGDEAHQQAAGKMQNATPEEQQAMMAQYQKVCEDALKD